MAMAPRVALDGITFRTVPVSTRSRKRHIPIKEPAENPSIETCVKKVSESLPKCVCLSSGTMGESVE